MNRSAGSRSKLSDHMCPTSAEQCRRGWALQHKELFETILASVVKCITKLTVVDWDFGNMILALGNIPVWRANKSCIALIPSQYLYIACVYIYVVSLYTGCVSLLCHANLRWRWYLSILSFQNIQLNTV